MSSASKTALHFLLALFFCTLTTVAITRPLSRASFRSAPDVHTVHEGLSRHTFLEVATGSSEAAPAPGFVIRIDLASLAECRQEPCSALRAHRAYHFPLIFLSTHRRISSPKSADSDPFA
jgi:hypothetical protein